MNIQRLDNRRLLTPGEEETTPMVSVTKSYARLNPAASAALGVVPGVDNVTFGWDDTSKQHMFYKSADEKSGKKLSEAGTLNSESIYKRLVEGANYTFGPFIEDEGVKYFPLVLEEAVLEESAAGPKLSDDEYDAKYAGKQEVAASVDNDDFL